MENLTGLELLFLLARDQFTCREDCLVAVFHCLMINSGKKCVGSGDEWPETSSDEGGGSEALPAGWNSNHEVYSLRYVSDSPSQRYLLKIVKAGQSLLVNVLDVNVEKAAGMSVNVTNHVTENYKDFKTAYVNLADVSRNFHKEVLNQFAAQQDASRSGSSRKTDDTKQREKTDNPVPRPTIPERTRHDDEPGFLPIGRGDLNPFAGGLGGGMLADPSSLRHPLRPGMPGYGGFDPHGIPRGSVPPGARFDPLGPIGLGRGFSRPDPDHLPPPGYDDMFM